MNNVPISSILILRFGNNEYSSFFKFWSWAKENWTWKTEARYWPEIWRNGCPIFSSDRLPVMSGDVPDVRWTLKGTKWARVKGSAEKAFNQINHYESLITKFLTYDEDKKRIQNQVQSLQNLAKKIFRNMNLTQVRKSSWRNKSGRDWNRILIWERVKIWNIGKFHVHGSLQTFFLIQNYDHLSE